MVLSLRRLLRGLLFAVMFLLLTLAIAEALRLLADWLGLPDARSVPQGRAVPVTAAATDERLLDRLRLFWLAGG
jgi:hypothetical protein